MYFNGVRKDYIRVHYDLIKPYWAPIQNTILTVPGMSGGHLTESQEGVLVIPVPVTISKGSFPSVVKAKEDMAGWLSSNEPKELVFSNDIVNGVNERTYFAKLDGEFQVSKKLIDAEKGTVTFVCPDPYKYGPEQSITLNTDTGSIINVPGTAPTKPIFELDVLAPITFAMVSNGSEYMMIGTPTTVDDTPVSKEEKVFQHHMESLIGWVESSIIEEGYVNGTIASDSTGFYPQFAAPNAGELTWHGPAMKHSVPEPVQDFRAEMGFRFNTTGPGSLGRIEMYGLDDLNNQVFRATIEDKWYGADAFGVYLEIGNGERTEYLTLPQNLEDMYGRIKVIRKGDDWTLIIQQLDSGVGSIVLKEWEATLSSNAATAQVSQIQVAFQKFYDKTEEDMEVLLMTLYKLNNVTGIPYIADAGDTILFDFKNHDIRINGEVRKDLKDRGASPFSLKPGDNTLAILPSGDLSGLTKFRPAYK